MEKQLIVMQWMTLKLLLQTFSPILSMMAAGRGPGWGRESQGAITGGSCSSR